MTFSQRDSDFYEESFIEYSYQRYAGLEMQTIWNGYFKKKNNDDFKKKWWFYEEKMMML